MKFENDVFISYAHLDNIPIEQDGKGWITDFRKLLKTILAQTMGYDIKVWRDEEELTGNTEFTPEIQSQFPLLKILVSVITPRYIFSDLCRKELDEFYTAASYNGGISIGNKSRIFKIVKTPVDTETINQLPDKFHRLFTEILDYKFYIPDANPGRFKELLMGDHKGRPFIIVF